VTIVQVITVRATIVELTIVLVKKHMDKNNLTSE